ncbi:MAG: hypothetical protein JRE47_10175 [Deltaproteobacteria bacterium]|nr:hypothetical protein [Deltaproteobacteria bacterium]
MATIDILNQHEDYLANLDTDLECETVNEDTTFLSSLIGQLDMSDIISDREISALWGSS